MIWSHFPLLLADGLLIELILGGSPFGTILYSVLIAPGLLLRIVGSVSGTSRCSAAFSDILAPDELFNSPRIAGIRSFSVWIWWLGIEENERKFWKYEWYLICFPSYQKKNFGFFSLIFILCSETVTWLYWNSVVTFQPRKPGPINDSATQRGWPFYMFFTLFPKNEFCS